MTISENTNKIIHGDCLDILKRIPSESVDMIFADPPFNLNKKYSKYKDNLEFQEYLQWSSDWISEVIRVTKNTGSIFIHNIPKWLMLLTPYLNNGADFRHWIAWDAPTSPMGKSLQPSHYGILYYAKDISKNNVYEIRRPHDRDRKSPFLSKDYGGKKSGLHPFGPLVSDVWSDIHRVRHRKYRNAHPCQLPIHLLERLILMATDEDDIVLDPFMGTGTTAIASKKLGRKFIGIELDDRYVNIANENIESVNGLSRVGGCWVSYHLDEIKTIRDKDWDILSKHFVIPNNIRDIDFTKIHMKKE